MGELSKLSKQIEDLEDDLSTVDDMPGRAFIWPEIFASKNGYDNYTRKTSVGMAVRTAAGTELLVEILKQACDLPLGIPLKEAFRIVARRRIETLSKALRDGAESRVPVEQTTRESGIYEKKLLG